MVLKADQERVKTLLRDTITLLCKNGLEFRDKFSLEALIGVTLDEGEVFLLSINELVKSDSYVEPAALEEVPEGQSSPRQKRRKRVRMQSTEIKKEKVEDDAQQKRPREVSDREDHAESDGADELVFVKEEVGDGPGVWNVTETTVTTSDICYTDGVVASSSSVMQGEGFVAMENLLTSEGIQTTEWADQGNISQQQSSIGSSTVTTTAVTTGQGDGMSGFDQHQQQQVPVVLSLAQDEPKKFTGKVEVVVDEVTKKKKRICKYEGCTFETAYRSTMLRHQRRHAKSFFVCPHCKKNFVERYDLNAHIAGVHNKHSYVCKYCGKILHSRTGCNFHERKHRIEKEHVQFLCSFCPEVFDNIESLANHISEHTKSTEPIEVVVETQVDVKKTVKSENAENLRYCPVDGCTFTSLHRSSMSRHNRRCHLDKWLKCEFCDKSFIEKYDLKKHTEIAHANVRFMCSNCNKPFRYRSTLATHQKNHCMKIC